MTSWFWHKEYDTEPHGPVDDATLKEMARSGKLQRQDKVWKEGLNEWVIASSIPNLFAVPPPIVIDAASSSQLDRGTDSSQPRTFGSKRNPVAKETTPLPEPLANEAPITSVDYGDTSREQQASKFTMLHIFKGLEDGSLSFVLP